MAKAESYNDLIFQLGDLARERLANRPAAPRSMERVFRAEEALEDRRAELAELEQQMNDEDANHQDFLAQQEAERTEQLEIVKKWKKAVVAIEDRTKSLRKKLSSLKAAMRYERNNLKKAEERHRDLEITQHHDQQKIAVSRENLKKQRIILMRKQREIEELEEEFRLVLTPRQGQPGAEGILAHRRLLEMEDEAEARKDDLDRLMAELDAGIAVKEEEAKAAEEFLDQALFLLGEECYTLRLADPVLAALYPRLDRAQ